jgi:hypothetical protein
MIVNLTEELIQFMKSSWPQEKINKFREAYQYKDVYPKSLRDSAMMYRKRYYLMLNELHREWELKKCGNNTKPSVNQ